MPGNAAVILGEMFASRAEQLQDRVFDFYQTPTYFPELVTATPCVLEGGRGTGKTTVLRGLSYHGQAHLRGGQRVDQWPYYGVYLRVNTARVAAFTGPELPPKQWERVFGHYINLLLCESVLGFTQWYVGQTHATSPLGAAAVEATAQGLGVVGTLPVDEGGLSRAIAEAKRQFELYINTVVDAAQPRLSVLGAPVDELLAALMTSPAMTHRRFFFLIDEYENLSVEQQRSVNTLIKHAGEHYTFKIGVKELGWRAKTTLNENEQLQAPADYAAINIDERLREGTAFMTFAARICQERTEAVGRALGSLDVPDLQGLLPGVTEDEEAELLGVAERSTDLRKRLGDTCPGALSAFDALPPLYRYFIGFWSQAQDEPLDHTYQDFLHNRAQWDVRYGNYKHSLLYTLHGKRRGIRKYYTGLDTLVALAAGNIRFLVQLVEQCLRENLLERGEDTWLADPVSPLLQTKAAQKVAQRHLVELEGLSLIGPSLARLCVGLGRIFQVMAHNPAGHAPEVTQFALEDMPGDLFREVDMPEPLTRPPSNDPDQARRLIAEAVTHLALIRLPSTKPSGPEAVREYDYMLHPVFAALFEFSARRKRKMTLRSRDITGLVTNHRQTIRDVLNRNNRTAVDADADLPEQMYLFERYLREDV
jgi:hypothetical protein